MASRAGVYRCYNTCMYRPGLNVCSRSPMRCRQFKSLQTLWCISRWRQCAVAPRRSRRSSTDRRHLCTSAQMALRPNQITANVKALIFHTYTSDRLLLLKSFVFINWILYVLCSVLRFDNHIINEVSIYHSRIFVHAILPSKFNIQTRSSAVAEKLRDFRYYVNIFLRMKIPSDGW